MLQLKSINKTYGSGEAATEVLKNINLQVDDGELVVLSGPSGSGKSTLLTIIGGLLTPTSGEIIMNNESWQQLKQHDLVNKRLHEIGFIFQSSHLLPYLNIKDQLVFVGTEAGMKKKDASARAEKLLSEFGLSHRLNHYPKALSGGEKQRTAIARAFMNEPSIILADEPTASLDYVRAIQVVETIRDRVKNSNTSCIMITHDQRIFKYADKVYELLNGELKLKERETVSQ